MFSTNAREVVPMRSFLTGLCCPEQRQVISRIFFSLMTLLLMTVGLVDQASLSFAMLRAGGAIAYMCCATQISLALVAFLDVTVNDLLPPKYKFWFNRRRRHFVWGSLGVTYVGYSLIFMKSGSLTAGLLYALFGVWAATIATMDVIYEYNERTTNVER